MFAVSPTKKWDFLMFWSCQSCIKDRYLAISWCSQLIGIQSADSVMDGHVLVGLQLCQTLSIELCVTFKAWHIILEPNHDLNSSITSFLNCLLCPLVFMMLFVL
ncbi:hypothetical protein AMECASPLE_018355 [Ameca splendens]|uniref:Uncharacterized protein n=1 Tax=Ameca splendens TaxID=208324 RepID=A0ABV0XRN4_9TELE